MATTRATVRQAATVSAATTDVVDFGVQALRDQLRETTGMVRRVLAQTRARVQRPIHRAGAAVGVFIQRGGRGTANTSLSCEILVDGTPRGQSTSVSALAVATCSSAAL